MKEYKELEVHFHAFLNSAPEGALAVLPLGNESLVHWRWDPVILTTWSRREEVTVRKHLC
jgi:hypothetical protein